MNKTSDRPHYKLEQMDFEDISQEFAAVNAVDETHPVIPGPTNAGVVGPSDTFKVESPWQENERAAPSEFLRSALFSPNRRANRLIVGDQLATNKRRTIIVWGDSLTQFDLDLWMACVHLARFGNPVRVTVPQLLKLACRSPGGTSEDRVHESLSLLGCFQLKLTVDPKPTKDGVCDSRCGYGYSGNLIEHLSWERNGGRRDIVNVVLKPSLAKLFRRDRRTLIPAITRSQLGDRPLAQWMYAFFRTHRVVLPLPVPYYHRLSGASSSLSDFRSRVRKAMTLLTNEALLHSVSLRGEVLYVQRKKPLVEAVFTDAEWTVRSATAKPIHAKGTTK